MRAVPQLVDGFCSHSNQLLARNLFFGYMFGRVVDNTESGGALWLTFLLSVASGFLLGGLRPPSGSGMPVAGWHLGGPDLRPAHFLAVHAQQLLPLAGVALQQLRPGLGRALLPPLVAAYVLAWTGLVFAGLPRAG